MTIEAAAYIRRETAVSIVINMVLTALFFALVFGFARPVPVWGIGHYVFDFIPQAFMIALMATLVPGALASKARRAGTVSHWPTPPRLPRALAPRAILLGCTSAVASIAFAAALLWTTGLQTLPTLPALLAKLAFAAALARLITPLGLKTALAEP